MAKQKITKDMSIGEIFGKFPAKTEALANAMMASGMHCLGCAAANFESLEMGCKAHGLGDKDIANLVSKLNKIVGKS